MCHTMGWIERKKAYKTEVLNWDQVLIQGEHKTFKVQNIRNTRINFVYIILGKNLLAIVGDIPV